MTYWIILLLFFVGWLHFKIDSLTHELKQLKEEIDYNRRDIDEGLKLIGIDIDLIRTKLNKIYPETFESSE